MSPEKWNNVIFQASAQIPNYTEFEVKNSLVLFFFNNNKKFMCYNRGIVKNCNSIKSNNTGSMAEPQLLEAKEVWHYGDICNIFPIKKARAIGTFWFSQSYQLLQFLSKIMLRWAKRHASQKGFHFEHESPRVCLLGTWRLPYQAILIDVRRLITIEVLQWWEAIYRYPTFHLSVRIWQHLKSNQWWSPSVEVGGSCVQGSEWPLTSWIIYVSDTVPFSHEWQASYSSCLLILYHFQVIVCDVFV